MQVVVALIRLVRIETAACMPFIPVDPDAEAYDTCLLFHLPGDLHGVFHGGGTLAHDARLLEWSKGGLALLPGLLRVQFFGAADERPGGCQVLDAVMFP